MSYYLSLLRSHFIVGFKVYSSHSASLIASLPFGLAVSAEATLAS